MSKLFNFAGVSVLNGVTKMRFANDEVRTDQLVKAGHDGVRLIALDEPMGKLAAARALQTNPDFADESAQAAIGAVIAKFDKPKRGRGRPRLYWELEHIEKKGPNGKFLSKAEREAILEQRRAEAAVILAAKAAAKAEEAGEADEDDVTDEEVAAEAEAQETATEADTTEVAEA